MLPAFKMTADTRSPASFIVQTWSPTCKFSTWTAPRGVSIRVPATHQVIHVRLSDGRELWVSPGHPTADGRRLVDLKIGDVLDSARVTLVERVRYLGITTFDILPSGSTGFYWANGILLGSTLKEP